MKVIKYPDGTSYVKIMNPSINKITFKINSYTDLWHLNQLVDAHNSCSNFLNMEKYG
jgi:hypothetical protein